REMEMANEGKTHDFKSLGYKTLAQMAKDVLGDQSVPALTRIKDDASTLKHDEIARKVVHQAEIVEEAPKNTTVEASRPTSQQKERGRMFMFKPTGERVTVTKDRVGRN